MVGEAGRSEEPKGENGDKSLPAAEQIIKFFSAFLNKEAVVCFLFYLVPFVVVFGGLSFWLAASSGMSNKLFGVCWLIICVLELVVFWLLSRQLTYQRSCLVALMGIGGLLCWLLMIPLFHIGMAALWVLLLLILMSAASMLPWPAHFNLTLAVMFLLSSIWIFVRSQHNWAVIAIALPMCFLFMRFAADRQTTFVSNLAQAFLGRYCESSSAAALTTLRLLAWQASLLCESGYALLSYGGTNAEIVAGGEVKPSAVEAVFVQGLNQKAEDYNDTQGVIARSELGVQFVSACHDWFGHLPEALFFIRFITVIEGREQRVYLYVPFSFSARLAGREKVYRSLLSLGLLARIFLAATRSRFVSSDALLLSQRSISEREEELNSLIHLVNNIAQDIAIDCEELRETAGKCDRLELSKGETSGQRLESLIHNLAAASRALSCEVSDIKLLKELSRLRQFKHWEQVSVPAVVEEIRLYGEYRARKGKGQLKIMDKLSATERVRVISREFLEAALRFLVRQAGGGVGKNSLTVLQISSHESMVIFDLCGAGIPLESGIREQIFESEAESLMGDKVVTYLRGVLNLANLSGGQFKILTAEEGQGDRFVMELPLAAGDEDRSRSDLGHGRWVLCVDDNPQVTAFYGRVAEALNLQYALAASVKEAKLLVTERGRPQLVITDIQLGDASGLDLVRYVREKFGSWPPVIVVSGNSSEQARNKATAAGASCFLTKPLGRARLFAEIERALNGGKL